MNEQPKLPDSETIKRHVAMLQDVCRQFDELNELLDRAIASAEVDVRNSPSYTYRMRQQQKRRQIEI